MHKPASARATNHQRGMTLVELTIATTIMALVMGALTSSMQREAKAFGEMATISARERKMSETVGRIEALLQFARGTAPSGFLSGDLGSGDLTVKLDTTLGFPPTGALLIGPGTATEEQVEYANLDSGARELSGLSHGARCTTAAGHLEGRLAYWSSMAVATSDPDPTQWERQAVSAQGVLPFRGDGSGFSFRVPTDPGGTGEYFDAGGIRWGSTVGGAATLDGWSALRFQPVATLREDAEGRDYNGDGDTLDVFDQGTLELVTWDAFSGAPNETSTRLCPPIVLQEQCNWGGDLDADGFADPIFLWVPEEGRLEIRLYVTSGSINSRRLIRTTSTALFLRNGASE